MSNRRDGGNNRNNTNQTGVRESGTLTVASEDDILRARQVIREVAGDAGFGITDVTRIVTAVSELTRNIYLYADEGVMEWEHVSSGRRDGLELVFEDDGPGIENVEAALNGNYSTSSGMGRGLEGTQELMDEFEITTGEEGTTVTIRKWQR